MTHMASICPLNRHYLSVFKNCQPLLHDIKQANCLALLQELLNNLLKKEKKKETLTPSANPGVYRVIFQFVLLPYFERQFYRTLCENL